MTYLPFACTFNPVVLGYNVPGAVTIKPRMTISRIQNAVAEYFGLRLDEMISPPRKKRLAHPRQIAMYLSRELTEHSLPAIGNRFHRDHTTVLHAIGVVAIKERTDPKVAADIAALRERLCA